VKALLVAVDLLVAQADELKAAASKDIRVSDGEDVRKLLFSMRKTDLAQLLARAPTLCGCDPDHLLGFPQFPWPPAAS